MDESSSSTVIQLIILIILLLCGYLALLQFVYQHSATRSNLPMLAVTLFLIYGGVSGALLLVLSRMGSMEMIFVSALMLGACITVFLMLVYLFRHFRELQKGWLGLFLVYLFALGYITVFSRDGSNSTEIFTGFTSIEEAIRTGSVEPLNHMFLNVAVFVPIGFLFPFIHPEQLNKLMLVTIISAMMTVTIESIQLMLQLGQCDLEDIVANTAGGVIGFLFYRLYVRFFGRNAMEPEY